MTIEIIMILKNFLGHFSVSFPEGSMFAFAVIKHVSKLGSGFSNTSSLTTLYSSKGIVLFAS